MFLLYIAVTDYVPAVHKCFNNEERCYKHIQCTYFHLGLMCFRAVFSIGLDSVLPVQPVSLMPTMVLTYLQVSAKWPEF